MCKYLPISYNLLFEKWIPAMNFQNQVQVYSILEILENAYNLREIYDSSPIFEFGMYRFLFAFILDAFSITITSVKSIIEQKKFDLQTIQDYIALWKSRFDLFDNKHPFYQTPDLDEKKCHSVSILIQNFPHGINSSFFIHKNPQSLSPEICAQALCSFPAFITSGGKGNSPSINGMPPWYFMLKGHNLFETLMFNVYAFISSSSLMGIPFWRSDVCVSKKSFDSAMILEGLTWQPRIVHLFPSTGGTCEYSGKNVPLLIKNVIFRAGWGRNKKKELWKDSNVAYVKKKPFRPNFSGYPNPYSPNVWVQLCLKKPELPPFITQSILMEGINKKNSSIQVYGLITDGDMKFYDEVKEKISLKSFSSIQNMISIASNTINLIIKSIYLSDLAKYTSVLRNQLKKNIISSFWEKLIPFFNNIDSLNPDQIKDIGIECLSKFLKQNQIYPLILAKYQRIKDVEINGK